MDEKLKLTGAGCEEGTTTSELLFVMATGSPGEDAGNDVGGLLFSTRMVEEDASGTRELLCVDGVCWVTDVERGVSKLLDAVDEGVEIIIELLLCVTSGGWRTAVDEETTKL